MVSDSTLISMPLNGSAALMNHCISFNCSSFESVEGWNSSSIHFLAAASSANAGANPHASSKAATDTLRCSVMIVSSTSARCCLHSAPAHDRTERRFPPPRDPHRATEEVVIPIQTSALPRRRAPDLIYAYCCHVLFAARHHRLQRRTLIRLHMQAELRPPP